MSDPITDTAGESLGDAAQTVRGEVRKTARRTAKTVRKAAGATRKATAAAKEKATDVVQDVHEEVERQEAAGHRLLESVASGIENISGQLRGGGLGQALAEAESFARRNPLLFIAGAALAGFAIARMTAPRPNHDEAL